MKTFLLLITGYAVSAVLAFWIVACGNYQGYTISGAVVPYTFISVANFGNTTFESFYMKSDGSLTASSSILATGTVSSSPGAIIVNPAKTLLYLSMFNSNNIAVYGIAQMTAEYPSVLTPISGQSTFNCGTGCSSVALSPSGGYLYATAYNSATDNVKAYKVGTTGGLSSTTSDTAGVNASWVAVHPNGRFLYITNQGSSNISLFSVDTTGATIASVSEIDTDASPIHAVIDPSGKVLIVANTDGSTLTTYRINSTTGALTAVSSYATGTTPVQIAMHATKNFVYVTNIDSSTISGFILDPNTGTLSAMSGSPFTHATQTYPYGITIDPSGTFAIVTWTELGAVSVYRIDQTSGNLSSTGSEVSVGVNPKGVVAYQLNRTE